MAAASGGPGSPLIERLFRTPQRFVFTQAVRILEWMYLRLAERDPRWRRGSVGGDGGPDGSLDREVVGFRGHPSLLFPPATVASLEPAPERPGVGPTEQPPPSMEVAFLGLIGPVGALPQHYTRYVLKRLFVKDRSLREFLALFEHRLVSHFYRASRKYRLPLVFEESRAFAEEPEDDPFTRGLFSLVGLGTEGLRRRLSVDDDVAIFYSGHYSHFPRSAVALEELLSDYFELPIAIEQFAGGWLALGPADCSRTADAKRPEGQNMRLGESTVAGERVWDHQSKFRVRIGPLDEKTFRGLLPRGSLPPKLASLVRLYAGDELDFDVQLVIRRDEIPPARLRAGGESQKPGGVGGIRIGGDGGCELGWTSWLYVDPPRRDDDQVFFTLDAPMGQG